MVTASQVRRSVPCVCHGCAKRSRVSVGIQREWTIGPVSRRAVCDPSPFARGNQIFGDNDLRFHGPIPVRTGEPHRSKRAPRRSWAYPRSHGGTVNIAQSHGQAKGLSPFARGTSRCAGVSTFSSGLSPFARGNRGAVLGGLVGGGPIPVRTGEPCMPSAERSTSRAYPRSHGGTRKNTSTTMSPLGLSPFARGNLSEQENLETLNGPIPVRTGEPPWCAHSSSTAGAYPRSHGGTSCQDASGALMTGLSPFARGNPYHQHGRRGVSGPIPVRTGEPTFADVVPLLVGAYPRSHGGTEMIRTVNFSEMGLSPFARGNPYHQHGRRGVSGPIPVRTGEPRRRWAAVRCCWAYPRSHGGTAKRLRQVACQGGLSPFARGNR